MFIVKHYTCPVYKTGKCKIYKIDNKLNVIKSSIVFDLEILHKMLLSFKVKNALYVECRSKKHIETLNNMI